MRVAVLPGDGIGPEVTAAAVECMREAGAAEGLAIDCTYLPVGGDAIEQCGEPLPAETLAACRESDAVLLGAVGGPKWDRLPRPKRPESGLLALRASLGLCANIRPVRSHRPLVGVSPLRADVAARGMDVLIVRELSGGLYYGTPSRCRSRGGTRSAVDTMRYDEHQVERVVRLAFQLSARRRRGVLSVDKANVLSCSRLWRETAQRVAADYPGVALEHMYVDAAAAELVLRPWRIDVLVTENTFGDILSDLAGAAVGSLGLLPSASLGHSSGPGLFEPVHGSAPGLAGRDLADPIGAILSASMLLMYSGPGESGRRAAARIESAVMRVLDAGYRTPDIAEEGSKVVGTSAMGDLVRRAIRDDGHGRGGPASESPTNE
ncbi:MAG: 3-isopropylmalate dehydrogenase [Firmicutes bacterium]|jgi:3-isopropylmalate dehydrogenase|nr:3-isopropylmalate dehydrogenase [Bacillota bacterium]